MALNQSEVDKFVKKIYNLYAAAFKEAVRVGYVADHDTEKVFSFADYPEINKKVNKLLADLSSQVVKVVDSGTELTWLYADQQNDALVKKLFGSNPPEAVKDRYLGRNIEALQSFQTRKDAGLNLSKRVWSHVKTLGGEIEAAIDLGLLDGRPASELAQDIKQYLVEPDKLFRRVRGANGILRLSKAAKAYNPGQGVYRSSYKNAERVARTEINMAYRTSDHERWKSLDFVVGFEVKRSNHPFGCDRCESLKGKYPKTFKFSGWHPQCRCYAISILATDDEIDELERRILNDEDTEGFKSVNSIDEVPARYSEYVNDNKTTLLKGKTYFLKDNLLTKPVHTVGDISELFSDYATLYPEDYVNGFGGVQTFRSKPSKTGFSMMSARPDGLISLNSEAAKLTGLGSINPYKDFKSALNKIRSNEPLEFKEEYFLESFYHEILHQKAKGRKPLLAHGQGDFKRTAMEIVNQFVARHDYPTLIQRLGGKAVHQDEVLNKGLGYSDWLSRFRTLISVSETDEKAILTKLRPILLEKPYDEIDRELASIMRSISGSDLTDTSILRAIEQGNATWYKLIDSVIANRRKP